MNPKTIIAEYEALQPGHILMERAKEAIREKHLPEAMERAKAEPNNPVHQEHIAGWHKLLDPKSDEHKSMADQLTRNIAAQTNKLGKDKPSDIDRDIALEQSHRIGIGKQSYEEKVKTGEAKMTLNPHTKKMEYNHKDAPYVRYHSWMYEPSKNGVSPTHWRAKVEGLTSMDALDHMGTMANQAKLKQQAEKETQDAEGSKVNLLENMPGKPSSFNPDKHIEAQELHKHVYRHLTDFIKGKPAHFRACRDVLNGLYGSPLGVPYEMRTDLMNVPRHETSQKPELGKGVFPHVNKLLRNRGQLHPARPDLSTATLTNTMKAIMHETGKAVQTHARLNGRRLTTKMLKNTGLYQEADDTPEVEDTSPKGIEEKYKRMQHLENIKQMNQGHRNERVYEEPETNYKKSSVTERIAKIAASVAETDYKVKLASWKEQNSSK